MAASRFHSASSVSLPFLAEDVVRWCHDDDREIISDPDRLRGTEVVRVGQFAIKHGNVRKEEARNQQSAYEIIGDSTFVRVPQVYQYLSEGEKGYLIMEYIVGAKHPSPQDPNGFTTVAKALNYLHSFESPYPGPLAGGPVRGDLWSPNETNTFHTVEALESYLNSRIVEQPNRFAFSGTKLVLCHSDIAPRNVLLSGVNLYLLDWEFAGYWPRSFEVCALRRNHGFGNADGYFCEIVENEMLREKPMSFGELVEVDLMMEVTFNYEKYCL